MSLKADEISTQVRSYDARLRVSILAGDVVAYMRCEEKKLVSRPYIPIIQTTNLFYSLVFGSGFLPGL